MKRYTPPQLQDLSARTLAHYDAHADAFWLGTRDHDVSQNYSAFLGAIESTPPFRILDLGCGPGRDTAYFHSLGHDVVGLDGAASFVEMARRLTGCDVLHQDFLALSLGARRFDGIFANASLFHVPTSELRRVLGELREALADAGEFWNAHEAWEERWRVESDPAQRRFLQGLIQIAAACHKLLVMGSPDSAARLFAKGLAKLDVLPADLDLVSFRDGVGACARALEEGHFERASIPRLR